MVVSPILAEDIKTKFRAIADLDQQNKDNNSSKNDLYNAILDQLSMKKAEKKVIKQAYKNWVSLKEKIIQDESLNFLDAIGLSPAATSGIE